MNLYVNRIIVNIRDPDKTISIIYKTVKATKSNIKNTTMLRNLIDLSVGLPNYTQWSGKCSLVNRFVLIQKEQIAISKGEIFDLLTHGTRTFSQKATKYGIMLNEIYFVTNEIQKLVETLRKKSLI